MGSEQPGEINDVAPTSLGHIIGQSGVVAQVSVALDAAFADNGAAAEGHGVVALGTVADADFLIAAIARKTASVFGEGTHQEKL